jgi:hypothetical protein
MGAWGTGLFDDDLANDMRDLWGDRIAQGSSAVEASTAIRENFEQDCAEDYDDGPVFWLVLASLQQGAETLQPDVRDRALASITQNAEKWHSETDPSTAAERDNVLTALRTRLTAA